jgi:hypothetical protein
MAKLETRASALPAREAVGAVLVSEILRERCVIELRRDWSGPADEVFD